MVKIIRPETISFRASVSEDEIRDRMAQEVLEQIGAVDAGGKRLPSVSVTVHRGPKGGYTIDVTGPAPPQLMLPGRTD